MTTNDIIGYFLSAENRVDLSMLISPFLDDRLTNLEEVPWPRNCGPVWVYRRPATEITGSVAGA